MISYLWNSYSGCSVLGPIAIAVRHVHFAVLAVIVVVL